MSSMVALSFGNRENVFSTSEMRPSTLTLALGRPCGNTAAIKDTAIKDTAIKDTAIKDTAIKDTAIKDTAIKDTAMATSL
ncbi:hypothetical protein EYF80_050169 [Liparis tanakae]|uniref:Uncharacterized protein n=1 Tax=Liparis tanakae TaxID=230148 RepID=A0A4Z2FEK3_9TELE|nr:hypothetical protein EYF80_050169 [Liparis tanakae]